MSGLLQGIVLWAIFGRKSRAYTLVWRMNRWCLGGGKIKSVPLVFFPSGHDFPWIYVAPVVPSGHAGKNEMRKTQFEKYGSHTSHILTDNSLTILPVVIEQGKKVCKTTGFRSLSLSRENKVNMQIAITQKVLPLRVRPFKIILSPRFVITKIY